MLTSLLPMPYRQVYYPAPKDESLPVHQELPDTAHVRLFKFEAMDFSKDAAVQFWTHCQHCAGWIPKQAYESRVNTLDGSRLCGRRGTEWYCPRCGREIHFEGLMS